MDGYQPGPSGSGEIVLDLSTRKKPEDTNNNIKTEQGQLSQVTQQQGTHIVKQRFLRLHPRTQRSYP